MVGLMDLKVGTIFVLLMIYMVLVNSGVEGHRNLSTKHEDLELEKQLKLLNKPAVKSIKTKYGDIYDCVEIKKQPAFDHPLLRNHTIQMKPSSLPKGLIDKELLESKPSKIGVKSSWCPPRTVLIRRTQKEDIIRAKSQVRGYHGNSHQLTTITPGYHFGAFELVGSDRKYYGGYVHLAIDQPKLYSVNQFSEAVLWLENGPVEQLNSIQVGWTVNPKLFGDIRPRIFSYWTADGFHNTGCFNYLCPGFVQVSRKVAFGMAYDKISKYGGPTHEDDFLVFKDIRSGNWWYVKSFDGEKEHVGYWPSSLFPSLQGFASTISAGGEVYSPTNEPSPEMGNGHFPKQDTSRATIARRLQIVNGSNYLVDPDAHLLKVIMDNPACYKAEIVDPPIIEYFFNSLLFGGPGGKCGI